jgi:hypothetical protein
METEVGMSGGGGDLETSLALLGLGSGRGGRRPAHNTGLTYVRDLVPEDLAALAAPSTSAGAMVPATLRLRQSHHTLARLIAQGTGNAEISAITGYAPATISRLRSDPAMRELVAYYEAQAREAFVDVHSRLATLGTTAVEILQEKLDETPPEDLSIKTLREVAEFALDRSVAPVRGQGGAGPPGTGGGVTLNVSFVAPQGAARGTTIEGEVVRDGEQTNSVR